MSGISIHALLAESDPLKRLRRKLPQISIHALLAESDGCTEAGRAGDIYFYPRSPCGERPISWKSPSGWNRISIHALLAESDAGTGCCLWHPPSISIHALLAESDLFHQVIQRRGVISIHALLAESDGAGLSSCFGRIIFLSTLSLRRATKKPWTTCEILPISIHALLAESDTTGASLQSPTRISIHALLAESDRIKAPKVTRHMNFYPRSPCGERLIVSLLVSMSY